MSTLVGDEAKTPPLLIEYIGKNIGKTLENIGKTLENMSHVGFLSNLSIYLSVCLSVFLFHGPY